MKRFPAAITLTYFEDLATSNTCMEESIVQERNAAHFARRGGAGDH
jgi:hypothetical protein